MAEPRAALGVEFQDVVASAGIDVAEARACVYLPSDRAMRCWVSFAAPDRASGTSACESGKPRALEPERLDANADPFSELLTHDTRFERRADSAYRYLAFGADGRIVGGVNLSNVRRRLLVEATVRPINRASIRVLEHTALPRGAVPHAASNSTASGST